MKILVCRWKLILFESFAPLCDSATSVVKVFVSIDEGVSTIRPTP